MTRNLMEPDPELPPLTREDVHRMIRDTLWVVVVIIALALLTFS